MMRFTDKIANYIQENNLSKKDLVIVLPSERAKKYVAASLFDLERKAMIAPKMTTMDAWIRSVIDETVVDKTRLLIKLFGIQQSIAKENEELSFDEFLEWGPILLSDFDELDRYLIDAKTIFKDLHNIKELEYWKMGQDDFVLSDARKRFLAFWDTLPEYYQQLANQLKDEKLVYMGAAYRLVASSIDLVFKENKAAHFIFAGFNAWSKAEMTIVKQLHKMGRAHVIADADAFYMEDENHEAGLFIRRQIKELGVKSLPFIEDQLLHKSLKINVIECAQTTGQIKVAATRLQEMTPQEISQTVVLLADESLIGPLLRNIPRNVEKANITLGMPLKSTAVKNWVDILFSIQESKRKYSTNSIYHNDLNRLLNHPFLVSILNDEEKKTAQELEQKIIRNNWVFIGQNNIVVSDEITNVIQLINLNWNNDWKVALQTIRHLNRILFKSLGSQNQFEKALLHSFDTALIDFENIVAEGLPKMSLKSFRALFNQHWSNKGIAYHGNPIDGLQIMGLLETRLLDFKHVICLGMNEGMMPPTNPIQSFLPMDLRRFAELPTPRDKQGLFAHHFYRLLHHCEDLLVTYSGTKESISSSERSRYLLQLEKELVRKNKQVEWTFNYYKIPMEDAKHVEKRSIVKDELIFQKMDELFERSTSISTLKKYVTCPLNFYYQYILEFGEEDEVEEEMESNTLGTIIHEALEKMYEKHAKFNKDGTLNSTGGLPLTVADIETMLFQCDAWIEQGFKAHFNGDENAYLVGKNNLSFTMAKQMVRDFLETEKKLIEAPNTLIIHSLETKLQHPLKLNIHGVDKEILLNGTIDRIDELNGNIRLVDYKSGKCNPDDVKYLPESNRTSKKEWQRNFEVKFVTQLLMYCFLYSKKHGTVPQQSGIISMNRLNHGLFELNTQGVTLTELVDRFPEWIQSLFEQMYDSSIPFEHVKKDDRFNYCNYCE